MARLKFSLFSFFMASSNPGRPYFSSSVIVPRGLPFDFRSDGKSVLIE